MAAFALWPCSPVQFSGGNVLVSALSNHVAASSHVATEQLKCEECD